MNANLNTSEQPGVDEAALLLEAANFLDNSMFQSMGQAGRAEALSGRIRAALTRRAPPAELVIEATPEMIEAVRREWQDPKATYGSVCRAVLANQGAAQAQAGDNPAAMVRDLVALWDSGTMPADDYNDAMCKIEDRMRAAMAAPAQRNGGGQSTSES